MDAMSDERRESKRHTLWVPIEVRQGQEIQMLAVSRNISASGVLVVVGATLEVGGRVELKLQVPGEDDEELSGEIVRVEVNAEDPDGLWRYQLAIRFDQPVPQLIPAFERLEKGAG